MSKEVEIFKVENKKIESYKSYPKGCPRRVTDRTQHVHLVVIDGETYSFIESGWRQRIWKADFVSFDYVLYKGKYKNILAETIRTVDKNGNETYRGEDF